MSEKTDSGSNSTPEKKEEQTHIDTTTIAKQQIHFQEIIEDKIQTPVPTSTPLLGQQDIIAPLQAFFESDEIWLIRRIFRVLNTYCPSNDHDQKLIAEMERLIVKELSNGK